MYLCIVILFLSLLSGGVLAGVSVTASVRGKKYEVEAETVGEFVIKVAEVANLDPEQQSVLFKGKVLLPTEVLSEVGVQTSDVLMVVKGKRARTKQEVESENQVGANVGMSGASEGAFNPNMPQSPADMEKAMKQMDTLLDSNFMDEYFKDDETLEKARQQMLDNLDQYEKMMPGFKAQAQEIVSSPEKW